MSTETLEQDLTPGEVATFGAGTQFVVLSLSASVVVDIIARRLGDAATVVKFTGVPAGFKYTSEASGGFDVLEITTTAAQSIQISVGDDDVTYSNAVTVVGGTVQAQEKIASSVSDVMSLPVSGPGWTQLVPANGNRRRVIFGMQNLGAGTTQVTFRCGANVNYSRQFMLPVGTAVTEVTFEGTYEISANTAAQVAFFVHEDLMT